MKKPLDEYFVSRFLAHVLGAGLCYLALSLLGLTQDDVMRNASTMAGAIIVLWACDALALEALARFGNRSKALTGPKTIGA